MGAAMAPAAADTIYQHLVDTGRTPEDYDRIITGDLGSIGQTILKDLLAGRGVDLQDRHDDCGILWDPGHPCRRFRLWLCGRHTGRLHSASDAPGYLEPGIVHPNRSPHVQSQLS